MACAIRTKEPKPIATTMWHCDTPVNVVCQICTVPTSRVSRPMLGSRGFYANEGMGKAVVLQVRILLLSIEGSPTSHIMLRVCHWPRALQRLRASTEVPLHSCFNSTGDPFSTERRRGRWSLVKPCRRAQWHRALRLQYIYRCGAKDKGNQAHSPFLILC